ncbi:hypothetical protein AB9X87_15770 (plasmid) [Lactiplantibacillus plantarum]|uniref:hypothetical protein n=1 Tax=Lactiplantibacillus plantarum TaxID=1590 RepID=UPI0035252F2D
MPNIESGNFQLLLTGDIVLADASEDYKEIAEPMLMKNINGRKVVPGLHTIAIRLKYGDFVYYLYLFLSPSFRHYVYKVGTGLNGLKSIFETDFKRHSEPRLPSTAQINH